MHTEVVVCSLTIMMYVLACSLTIKMYVLACAHDTERGLFDAGMNDFVAQPMLGAPSLPKVIRSLRSFACCFFQPHLLCVGIYLYRGEGEVMTKMSGAMSEWCAQGEEVEWYAQGAVLWVRMTRVSGATVSNVMRVR